MVNILQNKIFKKVALVTTGVLVVGATAVGTGFLMSHITPSTETKQPVSQKVKAEQMELGRKNVISGTEKASKGEQDAAISLYEEAITHFEKAEDQESVGAVQLEVQYLERVKTMNKSTTPDPTATIPPEPTHPDATKDPGYGVTATYPTN